MDELQTRIVEDLTGVITGDMRFDPLTIAMYASDASLYQIPPLGVIYPRDTLDVITIARYCAEHHIAMVPRGAGTSVAGNALGSGLVLDFSRFMNNIEAIDDETVQVQPGVVRDELNRRLREHGRYFPPDPANGSVTTMGSMLALDAAGSHCVRVGSTRDHVKTLSIVLADGSAMTVGNEKLSRSSDAAHSIAMLKSTGSSWSWGAPTEQISQRTLISKLGKILADNAELINERQPALIRNCCGYYLRGILKKERLNLPRLLVGSEGTLAMFTSATLHTAPLPAHRGVGLLLFGRIEDAVQAVQIISPQQPSACDLLDRRLLSLARESDPRFAQIITPRAEAGLLVEQTGFSDRQVQDRIQMAAKAVRAQISRVALAQEAYTFEDVEFLWSLPSRVVPLLNRLQGTTRPQPFVEDVAVPPEALNEFLIRSQKVFQKHKVTASLYAHAASGQLHLRPFLPAPGPEDGQRLEAIARDLYQAVFLVGGSISGEHGDGLSRTAFIRSQYGPLYRVFQQIKDLFDPHNLLNPGKIVSDDAHVTVRNLRPPLEPEPDELVQLQLNWSPQELADATGRCNGCGVCKTQETTTRMCPFFQEIESLEEYSPRSKANVLRNFASGQLDEDVFALESMKRLASSCFNCKQCQLDCPSNVNIPQMMIEAKAQYVEANGLKRAEWFLARAHSFGRIGSGFSVIANRLISSAPSRWMLERLFGIARERKLPRFARKPFLKSVPKEMLVIKPTPPPHPKQPVVFFVDHYANYHDPELAKAFLEILTHHQIPVWIPPEQTGSGMALISGGDLDAARDVADRNVRALAEFAREGYTIVCTEPAAALCLQQEYPMLVQHPDVELIAGRVMEAGAFLESLWKKGELRTDFAPVPATVGYHTPCHLKALSPHSPLSQLLTLIPELELHKIEKGCSGMAGAYGLTQQNFATSLQIGRGLIDRMKAPDLTAGTTECSSCKIQMEQETTTPTIHPLKLLALSYGLMPEIQRRLAPSRRKLNVS